MQVGKYALPLRMNVGPFPKAGIAQGPEQSLSRQLLSHMGLQAFQQNQARYSLSARTGIAQGARSDLYQALGQRLNALPTSLPSLTEAVSRLVANGPATAPGRASVLSSGQALDLGTATSVGSGGTGSGPAKIDPDGKLADQPFKTAITAGTLDFRITLNGNTQNVSVAIDPTKVSLNDVLGQINAHPAIAASYDGATGEISFDVTNQGARFEFTQTGTSSNFLQVMLQDQQRRITSAQGGQAVAAVNGETAYNDLTITYQGQQLEITGLTLSNKLKNGTAQEKAADLATQINGQLVGKTNLRASAAGGVLSFNATETGTQPALATGISFVETAATATSGGGKGGGKKGGGGTTPTSTLSLGLDNAATTSRVQITGTPRAASTTGTPAPTEKLGPGATLKDLEGQLGLASTNGQYTFSINGTQLSFNEDQTLDEVLDGISRSSAGVSAAYDPAGQRVVLTAQETGAKAIVVQDQEGNLTEALGLQASQGRFSAGAAPVAETETVTSSALSEEGLAALRGLGEQLGEALSLVETATGARGAFKDDALLEDLGAAIEGLFGQGGLGDLGFSLEDGQVRFDEARLRELSPEQLEQANAMLGSFIGEKVQPLVRNATQAIADDPARSANEQRVAQQAVMVTAEIARMQQRQQLLLFHQVTLEKQQDSLKQQDSELEKMRGKLGEPQEDEERQPIGRTPEPQPVAVVEPAAVSPIGGAAPLMPPGLASFGLGS